MSQKLLSAAKHLREELRKARKWDIRKDFSLLAADAQLGTAIHEIETAEALQSCDDCNAQVPSIIGCPDGANICQACFDAGNH